MSDVLEGNSAPDLKHVLSRHAALLDEMQSEFTKTKVRFASVGVSLVEPKGKESRVVCNAHPHPIIT